MSLEIAVFVIKSSPILNHLLLKIINSKCTVCLKKKVYIQIKKHLVKVIPNRIGKAQFDIFSKHPKIVVTPSISLKLINN